MADTGFDVYINSISYYRAQLHYLVDPVDTWSNIYPFLALTGNKGNPSAN